MTDEELIKRLRSQIGDDVQQVYDHEALFRLSADRIEALLRKNDNLFDLAQQEHSRAERLVDAMKALEKAAAEVSRRGAETGPQWTKLTVALLQARAALTQKDRTDAE